MEQSIQSSQESLGKGVISKTEALDTDHKKVEATKDYGIKPNLIQQTLSLALITQENFDFSADRASIHKEIQKEKEIFNGLIRQKMA